MTGPPLIQRLARPWLVVDFGRPLRALSWAPHRPGPVETRRVAWREVRDADLTPKLDAEAWLAEEMARETLSDAVGLLTSRDVSSRTEARAEVEGLCAACLATVGLGNAERAGAPRRSAAAPAGHGTINLVAVLDAPLSETALIEALSIAVQARTRAVMESGRRLPHPAGGPATGTGTDCVVVAAPAGPDALRHAGLHTAAGEALGRAVHAAVAEGARDWMQTYGRSR